MRGSSASRRCWFRGPTGSSNGRRRPGRGPAACSGRRRRSPLPPAARPQSRPSPGSRSARPAAGRRCRHIRSYARRSAERRNRRAGRPSIARAAPRADPHRWTFCIFPIGVYRPRSSRQGRAAPAWGGNIDASRRCHPAADRHAARRPEPNAKRIDEPGYHATAAPPVAEQRPHSFERHGIRVEDPYHWLQGPGLSDGRRRGRAFLPARRECLFRGGDGAAPAADRDPVPGDARPHPRGRQLGPGPRRRLALLVGVPARRAVSHLVPPPGRPFVRLRTAGEAQIIFDEAGRSRGQAIFPAGRARDQPRRPLRRDHGRRRRFGALPAPHPRSRQRPRHRDGDRGRHRRAGLDRRQPRHRLHRGQRQLAQLPRPAAPARRAGRERRAPFTKRPRMSPSRSRSAAPRTGASSSSTTGENSLQRDPPRPDRQSAGRAGAGRPAPAEHPVFGRRQPRQIVDPDQRQSCQFPPRRGVARPSRRVARRHRRLGRGLSARHHRLSRPSRHHRAGQRPRSDPAAQLRRQRAPHPVRRGEPIPSRLGDNPEYAPAAYRLSYASMVTPPTVYDYHPAENRLETLQGPAASLPATIPAST